MNIGDTVVLKNKAYKKVYGTPSVMCDLYIVGGEGGNVNSKDLEEILASVIATQGFGIVLEEPNENNDVFVAFSNVQKGIYYKKSAYYNVNDLKKITIEMRD